MVYLRLHGAEGLKSADARDENDAFARVYWNGVLQGCRPVAQGYVVCSRDSSRILGKVGMPTSPAPVMWVRQSRQYQDLE